MHATVAKVTVASALDGKTEYNITCSSTPARAKAVRQACPQVLRTFKVSNLFKAAAALNYRAHGVSFDNHVQGEAAFQACMSLASRGCRSLGRGWGRV
jgi:hypothetical protein